MTTFTDGPAAAIQLNITRTPIFLRVVHDKANDQWDALDQLADTPKPTEEIHVYRIEGEPMRGFWDGTDGRGRRTGGMFVHATYRLNGNQPDDVEGPLVGLSIGRMLHAINRGDWLERNPAA